MLAPLTVLGVLSSAQVVHLFTAFGSGGARWNQAIDLNRIMFPYIFFIGLAALAMAILNCFHVFATPAGDADPAESVDHRLLGGGGVAAFFKSGRSRWRWAC